MLGHCSLNVKYIICWIKNVIFISKAKIFYINFILSYIKHNNGFKLILNKYFVGNFI